MIAVLFLASFPYVILAVPQTWEWDETARATSYRIYYGDRPGRWCGVVDVAATCAAGRCTGDLPEGTEFEYLTITAVNAFGESPDHPTVEVCP